MPRKSRTRKRGVRGVFLRIAFSLTFFAVILVVALVVGEGVCRWLLPVDAYGWYQKTDDPILYYRLTPSRSGTDLGAARTHSAQGVRGQSVYASEPEAGMHRVLWIGDSACFGTGVGDDETAPAQMEQLAAAGNRRVEAINLGVVGYNLRQVVDVLRIRSQEFHGAEAIIYLHHNNDIVNCPWWRLAAFVPSELRKDYDPPATGMVRRSLRRSVVAQYLRRAAKTLRGDVPGRPDSQAGSRSPSRFTKMCLRMYKPGNRYGKQFRADLELLANTAKQARVPLVVVWWPTRDATSCDSYDSARASVRQWTGEVGASFIDLTEAFEDHEQAGLYVDPLHPGAPGLRIVAAAVTDFLFPTIMTEPTASAAGRATRGD